MKERVLVAYATKRGSTAEIAEKIGEVLKKRQMQVDVLPARKVADLSPYKTAILGTAVYIGLWRREAVKFLKTFADELVKMPLRIFLSGPTGAGDPLELLGDWRFPESLRPVIEQVKPVEPPKPIEQSKLTEPPKHIEQPKPVEQPPSPVEQAKPAPPVTVPPAPPPIPSAKQSNDIMRDVLKDIELPPDAPKLGEISPEANPKKAPALKLPDVPVVAESKESVGRPAVTPPSSSLTEELAKELDEELKKIKKVEIAKEVPPPAPAAESPVKPSPRIEAKVPSQKTVDATLKIPGMASGSNAYLALVRQRISNMWTAPPVDITNQVYVVIVQFRLHRNG
ncbi:MAG TPA: flavodoxin domain-containing protein, partial [Alphaproteobacteria bacterium]|nr:flavodoxin domain-containing protein [Alphaproteobacteria bacterium]